MACGPLITIVITAYKKKEHLRRPKGVAPGTTARGVFPHTAAG